MYLQMNAASWRRDNCDHGHPFGSVELRSIHVQRAREAQRSQQSRMAVTISHAMMPM